VIDTYFDRVVEAAEFLRGRGFGGGARAVGADIYFRARHQVFF